MWHQLANLNEEAWRFGVLLLGDLHPDPKVLPQHFAALCNTLWNMPSGSGVRLHQDNDTYSMINIPFKTTLEEKNKTLGFKSWNGQHSLQNLTPKSWWQKGENEATCKYNTFLETSASVLIRTFWTIFDCHCKKNATSVFSRYIGKGWLLWCVKNEDYIY